MNEDGKKAWTLFVTFVKKFLGKSKSESYAEHEMLKSFKFLRCSMSIKVKNLRSQLEHFLENLGHTSEEEGKRFHKDIKTVREHYQRK